MPVSTTASMIVNAYVSLSTYSTRTRNQTTSSAIDTKPDTANTPSSRRRLRSDRRSAGGPNRSFGSATSTRSASPSYHLEHPMAITPTITFTVAATRNDEITPRPPIIQNPATRVPVIAPAVLLAYSTLMRSPTREPRTALELATSGSVAPSRVAGTSSTTNDSTKRAAVSAATESGANPAIAT